MRNKYPGLCCICGHPVAAGAGHFEPSRNYGNKWLIRCKDCVGKGAPSKQKCKKCGKKLLVGEGHYEKIKEDEGEGWYSEIWIAHCDKCNPARDAGV